MGGGGEQLPVPKPHPMGGRICGEVVTLSKLAKHFQFNTVAEACVQGYRNQEVRWKSRLRGNLWFLFCGLRV